uniref:Homeobox domain-containing protein n=1 Tax=Timema douglasi TaxID=61478 RepID=A0A7R8VFQ8_TIMDO|nr:unnamed protein product [Timema douglasi]
MKDSTLLVLISDIRLQYNYDYTSGVRDGLGWLQLVLSPVRADKTRALPMLVGRGEGVHASSGNIIEYCDSASDDTYLTTLMIPHEPKERTETTKSTPRIFIENMKKNPSPFEVREGSPLIKNWGKGLNTLFLAQPTGKNINFQTQKHPLPWLEQFRLKRDAGQRLARHRSPAHNKQGLNLTKIVSGSAIWDVLQTSIYYSLVYDKSCDVNHKRLVMLKRWISLVLIQGLPLNLEIDSDYQIKLEPSYAGEEEIDIEDSKEFINKKLQNNEPTIINCPPIKEEGSKDCVNENKQNNELPLFSSITFPPIKEEIKAHSLGGVVGQRSSFVLSLTAEDEEIEAKSCSDWFSVDKYEVRWMSNLLGLYRMFHEKLSNKYTELRLQHFFRGKPFFPRLTDQPAGLARSLFHQSFVYGSVWPLSGKGKHRIPRQNILLDGAAVNPTPNTTWFCCLSELSGVPSSELRCYRLPYRETEDQPVYTLKSDLNGTKQNRERETDESKVKGKQSWEHSLRCEGKVRFVETPFDNSERSGSSSFYTSLRIRSRRESKARVETAMICLITLIDMLQLHHSQPSLNVAEMNCRRTVADLTLTCEKDCTMGSHIVESGRLGNLGKTPETLTYLIVDSKLSKSLNSLLSDDLRLFVPTCKITHSKYGTSSATGIKSPTQHPGKEITVTLESKWAFATQNFDENIDHCLVILNDSVGALNKLASVLVKLWVGTLARLRTWLMLPPPMRDNYWFAPIGLSLGIKNTKSKRAIPNDILESAYRAKGKIKHKQIVGLAKQLDWSERQVERWLRLRRSQDRPSTLVKFSETNFGDFWCVNTSIEAPKLVAMFPAYYIFNTLLCILLMLHFIWTYLILKIAYKALVAGQNKPNEVVTCKIRSLPSGFRKSSPTQTWAYHQKGLWTLTGRVKEIVDIMDDRRVDVLGLSETKCSGSVVRIVRNGFILHWMVEDEGSLNRVVFIMREEGLQVEMMEGDIRSSSSEVSDEPSGYDPTGTNSVNDK